MQLTIKALREKMESDKEATLKLLREFGDPQQLCEECGRTLYECNAHALQRNIERALERAKEIGIPQE